MSVSIKYKGTEIASASTEVTKTIKTAGKYCEADILVENTPDGGDAPVINPLSVTANGTYNAPSGVDGYSPITVNVPQGITPSGNINITDTNVTDVTQYATATVVDADLVASNIKEGINILGVVGTFAGGGTLPSVITKIDGGSFTPASDTRGDMYNISHNLGTVPKQILVWTDEQSLRNSIEEQAQRYLISAQLICREFISGTTIYSVQPLFQYRNTTGVSSTTGSWLTQAQAQTYITAVRFNVTVSSVYYKAGVEYKWVAFV